MNTPAPQDLAERLADLLLGLVPADGAGIGNGALRQQFLEAARAAGKTADATLFDKLRESLIAKGKLGKGKGRGGSVHRLDGAAEAFDLAHPVVEPAAQSTPKPEPRAGKPRQAAGPAPGDGEQILAYRHDDRRKNNPEVGMVTPYTDPEAGKTRWAYDPHLDPALQFDPGRAAIERLIDEALASYANSGDPDSLHAALEELKRRQSPYLNWSGKAERLNFEVDTVSLHVHERIDPMTILAAVRKRMRDGKVKDGPSQGDFFRAWFEEPLPAWQAVEFYRHDRGWMNRLVAGDSLLVMNSLLQKEGMAGAVQMIYIDPPYGIKYGSNFQPFTNKRDVKDRADADLTQEPEMIKAFRDTWELGIHSYLTYLRDRLLLAKELLHESGSVFVQIGDENMHHVRELLDEVMGTENFLSLITFKKTAGQTSEYLPGTCDYILWYGKNASITKFRTVFRERELGDVGSEAYNLVTQADGSRRRLTVDEFNGRETLPEGARVCRYQLATSQREGRPSGEGSAMYFPVSHHGQDFFPSANRGWSATEAGMKRLAEAGRIAKQGSAAVYIRYLDDFPAIPVTNFWSDTQSGSGMDKVYVVQTSQKIIERCLLMTTDPGDLVLDPTCGSGTTAFVAEKWGRRWITCDTSRVAATLAKQRLMTASYDYYELKYPHEGLRGGFIYKTVPHVTLKSIANNPEIDEIWARMHPAVEMALVDLNGALARIPPTPPFTKGGAGGAGVELSSPLAKSDADADLSPPLKKGGEGGFAEWEVPFDFPQDWPEAARAPFAALHAARQAMQQQMDRSIAAQADQETLYDQPAVSKTKLRVTGPFTVEAVPFPSVASLDENAPVGEADASIARSGESARQHGWRDELLKAGIRGKGGQMLRFAELETLPDTPNLHLSGHLDSGERVVVSFGPQHAALEQRQVANALNEAGSLFPLPKMLVFCAFAFDPEAAKDIDAIRGITALKAQMNTDLLTEDLKKARAGNQSFWLMGQPDVEVRKIPPPSPAGGRGAGGEGDWYQVEVHGFDYFDTVKGELVSGGKSKIALWLLDSDYDERSLFPRQVFFPMAGKGEGWEKLKRDIRAELNEDLLGRFHGTVSLPFEAGENRKIAVKIVDDRGIESLKVIGLA